MKSFLISGNQDTLTGMRLAGIEGRICSKKEEVMEIIEAKIEDKEVGVIMICTNVMDLARKEIMEKKLLSVETLIIEIPSMGEELEENHITKYIKESIGIKF